MTDTDRPLQANKTEWPPLYLLDYAMLAGAAKTDLLLLSFNGLNVYYVDKKNVC